jgi:hypothetical protein
MGVQLNHTIVWCADKVRSPTFLADILGLPAPTQFGPFQVIELENTVSLDFHETKDRIAFQHYAFLTDDERFDCRVRSHPSAWSGVLCGPSKIETQRDNRNDGRGFYFAEPDEHLLEVITRPNGIS